MQNKEGHLVKQIRKSKNYGQKDVANGVMHQTNYSKFELGKIEISFNKLKLILENLEMDVEEFAYLLKSYGSKRDAIIKDFKSLTFIDEFILKKIITSADAYLEKHADRYIEDIRHVSNAMLAVNNHDFITAKIYADKVWKRLEKLDRWYLTDIKLINNILFLFPIETARTISLFAIKQGEKYLDHDDYDKVILPFKYNLVHLLLKENEIEEARALNEDVLTVFKKKKLYMQIALCQLRKGLITMKQEGTTTSDLITKAYEIAELFEDDSLTEKIKSEEAYLKDILSIT